MATVQSKAARRQIVSEFKRRSVPRGIYAVRCSATGQAWVGSSPNLDAVQNSLWFQLRGGLSRHRTLQSAWIEHGEAAFILEIVEKFADDLSPLLLDQQLRERKNAWAAEFGAETL